WAERRLARSVAALQLGSLRFRRQPHGRYTGPRFAPAALRVDLGVAARSPGRTALVSLGPIHGDQLSVDERARPGHGGHVMEQRRSPPPRGATARGRHDFSAGPAAGYPLRPLRRDPGPWFRRSRRGSAAGITPGSPWN